MTCPAAAEVRSPAEVKDKPDIFRSINSGSNL